MILNEQDPIVLAQEKETVPLDHEVGVKGQTPDPSIVRETQLGDNVCGPMMRFLENSLSGAETDITVVREARKYIMIDGRLFRWARNGGSLLVVPASMRVDVIRDNHDGPFAGHGGDSATVERIKRSFWWPNVAASVSLYTAACESCKRFKSGPPVRVRSEPVKAVPRDFMPFQFVNMDIKGPLPLSGRGNKYIVSFMCTTTNYVEAFCTSSKASKVVATCFEEVMSRHGVPRKITSDNGTEFKGKMSALLAQFGIQHEFHAAYAHWLSGSVERFHRSIGQILSHYLDEHRKDWDEHLPYALFAYRTAFQNGLKASPFYLIFGRQPEFGVTAKHELLAPVTSVTARNVAERIHEAIAIRLRDTKKHKKRAVPKYPAVGGTIYAKNNSSHPPKLAAKNEGPFSVTKVVGDAIFFLGAAGIERSIHVSQVQLKRDITGKCVGSKMDLHESSLKSSKITGKVKSGRVIKKTKKVEAKKSARIMAKTAKMT